MNSRELVFSFRDGDCFWCFVEKDSQFSLFCCFGNESRLWLHVGTCAILVRKIPVCW